GRTERPDCSADPGGFLTLSGGTTGTPKIIRRRSASWLHSIRVMQRLLGISPASRVATLGDLSHSLALYASVEALVCGAQCHALHSNALRSLAGEIDTRKISHLYATPTQLRLLSAPPIQSVRYVIVGGGALDPAASHHCKTLFPNAKTYRFYGAVETSFITLGDDSCPLSAVGHAFPGVRIEIRNSKKKSQPPGTDGLIWVTSPMLFDRYVTGSSAHTIRDGDWLSVGEIGSLDEHGNLTVKGRVERVVNVADQLVYLDEIEAVICAHDAVRSAAVLALPDDLRGHALVAAVELAGPHLKDIKSRINAILPPSRRPRKIIEVKDWPMLPSGKTDYIALKSTIRTAIK
ncbi:MAG: long-chain fatty acid--CoA ligase, partial [Hyphomicrobiales bacterium]|nr:long-chain fatty acid--CoA ligase [Hyphomicrobiales bacterium]